MIHMPIRKQSSTMCITSYLILRVDLNHWSEEILLPPFQWAKSLSLTHPDERPPKNPACCRVQKPIPRSVTKIKADHGLLKAKLAWCGLTKYYSRYGWFLPVDTHFQKISYPLILLCFIVHLLLFIGSFSNRGKLAIETLEYCSVECKK